MSFKILWMCMLISFVLAMAVSEKGADKFPSSTNLYQNVASKIVSRDHNPEFTYSQPHIQKLLTVLGSLSDRSKFKEIINNHSNRTTEHSDFDIMLLLGEFQKNGSASECIGDIGRYITSILSGDSWAIQFLDATGKPGPSLTKYWLKFVGNYDQCRAAIAPPPNNTRGNGFKGNYCSIPFNIGVPQIVPTLGACIPSSCSSEDISSLLTEMLEKANIKNVSPINVQCLKAETKVTAATIVAAIILSVIFISTLLGTVYDLLFIQYKYKNYLPAKPKLRESKDNFERSDYHYPENEAPADYNAVPPLDETSPLISTRTVNKEHVDFTRSIRSGVATKILLAFSLYSNGKKLLNTSQASGSLGSIHGIRFLSMTWVVMGHTFMLSLFFSLNTISSIQGYLHLWTFDAISNAVVSVDTFFTLSGLLTSYLTIKELKRSGLKINWGLFYFHRFWRLTPPYMFVLVIYLGLQQYLGQGPNWANEQPMDKANCEKNWWTNLLYINNLVKPTEPCMAHTWYLANDMQYFVLSPLLVIPFYFHWMAGVGSCTVFFLISWITTGVLSTENNWGSTILSVASSPPTWFTDYYIAPWCRIGPYVVGILAGYVLAVTNGRPFRMRWWFVVLGWVVATATALAVLYGLQGDLSGEHPLSTGVDAFYNAVARSAWGACVCWVIVACSAGYGGPVNALLSWSPFVVLGRLTYMTYLIHMNILYIFLGNMGMLFYLNDTLYSVVFLGLLVVSNMASFVCTLLLESPMLALEKAFLRKERKD